MSRLVKLSDLCIKITDGSHYSPQGVNEGYPMLSSKDMQDLDFDFTQCKYISETDYKKLVANDCKPLVDDVLIIKDGNSYLQKVFVVREERQCVILSSIGVLRPDTSKLNPYYLKYYLSSNYVKNEVAKKYVSGSALPRIILKNFGNIEIPYIDIVSQEKVVSILKLIDFKIESNNKINKELESMAKTIYDYWFLQLEFPNEEGKPYKSSGGEMVWNEELKREIPAGWGNGTFNDLIEIGNGKDHKELHSGKIPVYGSGGVMRFVDKAIYTGESVLIPRKGTLNNIIYVNGAFWTVDTMFYTKIKKEHTAIFTYYSVKLYDFEKLNTGTGVPSMTASIIYNLKTVIPTVPILEKFDLTVQSLYKQIQANNIENVELMSLRDFLLPLLMNGQIKFENN